MEIQVKSISVGTIFKLVGMGMLFSVLPFVVLAGCTAAMGLNSLTWNNQLLTGWVALAASPFIGLFLVAFFTMVFGSAISFGLWIYSLLGPYGITYKPYEQPESTTQQFVQAEPASRSRRGLTRRTRAGLTQALGAATDNRRSA